MLSDKLLEILCCPKCHGGLRYDREAATLTCEKCGQVYKIENDIPIMIPDDEPPGS